MRKVVLVYAGAFGLSGPHAYSKVLVLFAEPTTALFSEMP